jgi:hypothetical protein
MPPAQDFLFCSESDVQALLSLVGEQARLDDDASDEVYDGSPGWVQAANYATAKVKAYCLPRYASEDMAKSWLVNEWATIIATQWLCMRRLNGVPETVKEYLYGDGTETNPGVMGELIGVRAGRFKIPDCPSRYNESPAYSNIRVDPIYRTRQIRTQKSISEKTPTQYPQTVDWGSEFNFEP